MKEDLISQLESKVKKRIELDWTKVEHRFIPKEDSKEHSDQEPLKLSSKEEAFLWDIFDDPDIPLTTRGDRLGLTSHMTTKTKNELISKKLVKQYEVNLGRINKFLEITGGGYAYLEVEVPEQHGKGSPEHRFWQRRVLAHYQDTLGLKAKIEESRNQKLVDVGVVAEDGKRLAVEIAMTAKNEFRNIKKDLAVGFHRVIVACRNPKVKRELEKKIPTRLSEEERRSVKICLLTEFL